MFGFLGNALAAAHSRECARCHSTSHSLDPDKFVALTCKSCQRCFCRDCAPIVLNESNRCLACAGDVKALCCMCKTNWHSKGCGQCSSLYCGECVSTCIECLKVYCPQCAKVESKGVELCCPTMTSNFCGACRRMAFQASSTSSTKVSSSSAGDVKQNSNFHKLECLACRKPLYEMLWGAQPKACWCQPSASVACPLWCSSAATFCSSCWRRPGHNLPVDKWPRCIHCCKSMDTCQVCVACSNPLCCGLPCPAEVASSSKRYCPACYTQHIRPCSECKTLVPVCQSPCQVKGCKNVICLPCRSKHSCSTCRRSFCSLCFDRHTIRCPLSTQTGCNNMRLICQRSTRRNTCRFCQGPNCKPTVIKCNGCKTVVNIQRCCKHASEDTWRQLLQDPARASQLKICQECGHWGCKVHHTLCCQGCQRVLCKMHMELVHDDGKKNKKNQVSQYCRDCHLRLRSQVTNTLVRGVVDIVLRYVLRANQNHAK